MSLGLEELTTLAYDLVAAGELVRARAALESALAEIAPSSSTVPPDLAEAASLYARVLLACGEPALAREWAIYARGAAERLYGPDDQRTVRDAATLAASLYRVGELPDAERLYRDVVARLAAREGPGSPLTLAARADLATVLHATGQCRPARSELAGALAAHQAGYGLQEPAGIRMLARLAAMSRDCADEAAAQRHFTRAKALAEAYLPADHPVTAQVRALSAAPPNRNHPCQVAAIAAAGTQEGGPDWWPPEQGNGPDGGGPPGGGGSAGPPDQQGPLQTGRVSRGHLAAPRRLPVAGHPPPIEPVGSPPGHSFDTARQADGAQAGAAHTHTHAQTHGTQAQGAPTDPAPTSSAHTSSAQAHGAQAHDIQGQEALDDPAPAVQAPHARSPRPPAPQVPGFLPVSGDEAGLADDPGQDALAEPTGVQVADPPYPIADDGLPIPGSGPLVPAGGAAETQPEDQPYPGRHLPPPPDPSRPHRARVAFGAGLAMLGMAGGWFAATTLTKHESTAPPVITTVERPSGPATTAGLAAPTQVRLRDAWDSVTLSWKYPDGAEGPVLVAGARAGEQQRVFHTLPPGSTSYTVHSLEGRADYCFTVAVVYSADAVARSAPVCTARGGKTTPSSSKPARARGSTDPSRPAG